MYKAKNAVAIYKHQNSLSELQVRIENETVWLSLDQLAELFDRDKSTISRHIKKVFAEGELPYNSVVANFATTASDGKIYQVDFYNLDVIISVGYRVKSLRGTQFRIWATSVLKDYLLKGYSINTRFELLENRVSKVENTQAEFVQVVNKALPPKQGIFFDGQVFDAYMFVADLIKNAKRDIVLIDNYVDESVLTLLSKRKANVVATIYTKIVNDTLKLDLQKHNAQYPAIEIKTLADSHDRFLIIDRKELYHIGASLKDVGKKWFAFSKMDSLLNELLNKLDPK